MSARPFGLALDLDRTLVDLELDIERVRAEVAAVFAPLGFTGRFSPILSQIDRAARQVTRTAADARALIASARGVIDRAEVAAAARAPIRPGARELLATATARGWPIGIVTNNGRACVAPALARLGVRVPDTVGCVMSRDEVAAPKPDPEGVERIARVLLPTGGTLWVVGDSVSDVQAAARARGVTAVAVAVCGGMSSRDALQRAGPHAVVADLFAAAAWITRADETT